MRRMLLEGEGLNKQRWGVWIGRSGGSFAMATHLGNVLREWGVRAIDYYIEGYKIELVNYASTEWMRWNTLIRHKNIQLPTVNLLEESLSKMKSTTNYCFCVGGDTAGWK